MKRLLAFLTVWMLLFCAGCAGAPDSEPTTEPTDTQLDTAFESEDAPSDTTETEESTGSDTGIDRISSLTVSDPQTENPFTGIFDGEVPTDVPVLLMHSELLPTNEPIRGATYEAEDPMRPNYNIGICQQMEGDIFYIILFVEDDESQWEQWEMDSFLQDKLHPGAQWLVNQAAAWGVTLNYTAAYYQPVRVEGVIGQSSETADYYFLQQVVINLGYTSEDEFYQGMVDYSGCEEVAIVTVIDKPGRCYAWSDWYNDGYDFVEYEVLYNQILYMPDGSYYMCQASTVAHETLHLFGAEDLYGEGDVRGGRSHLARQNWPNDVMLQTYWDVSYNYVSAFTAYCIGWTDQTPDICYVEDWWD